MYAYQHELDEQVHRARAIALSNPTSEHLAAYGLAITDRWVGTSALRRGTDILARRRATPSRMCSPNPRRLTVSWSCAAR